MFPDSKRLDTWTNTTHKHTPDLPRGPVRSLHESAAEPMKHQGSEKCPLYWLGGAEELVCWLSSAELGAAQVLPAHPRFVQCFIPFLPQLPRMRAVENNLDATRNKRGGGAGEHSLSRPAFYQVCAVTDGAVSSRRLGLDLFYVLVMPFLEIFPRRHVSTQDSLHVMYHPSTVLIGKGIFGWCLVIFFFPNVIRSEDI